MSFQHRFSVWNQLQPDQQSRLLDSVTLRSVRKGAVIRGAHVKCNDLFLIRIGQLRASILSDEGREFTLYRLFEGDLCLFCASNIFRAIRFDVTIQAEKDTSFWCIPTTVYRTLMAESAPVANYTNELLASRFSEVMARMEQLMWQSMDRRIAAFLLQEAAIEGDNQLRITHEAIANHLGSHREVITRILRHFQAAGLVSLSRGRITLLDPSKLEAIRA